MKTQIEDGQLIITLKLQKPKPSKTGKSDVVATTHGTRRTAKTLHNKRLYVNCNAFIRDDEA
jgi:hypothetical protein